MTQPVAAGPKGPARGSRPLVRFFQAVVGLSIVLVLAGAAVGFSAGVAHRAYRLVLR